MALVMAGLMVVATGLVLLTGRAKVMVPVRVRARRRPNLF